MSEQLPTCPAPVRAVSGDRATDLALVNDERPSTALPLVGPRGGSVEFAQLFGASSEDVLDAMDASADDLVERQPRWAVRIGAVGLTRRNVPARVHDPFGGNGPVAAVCTVKIAAAVPANKRGLHLSRVGDAVARSTANVYDDLVAYASWLAHAVARSQYGRARVAVEGCLPYLESIGSRTRGCKQSLEHVTLLAVANVTPKRFTCDAGLRVSHVIACPCVQETFKHALRAARRSGGVERAEMPLLTHSQRCLTTVLVGNLRQRFSVREVLGALDATLVRTCNTLPRDWELACVYRAHQTPLFIEDALRAAVTNVGALWDSAAFDRIQGRARSLESIHDYDLTASVTIRARELRSTGVEGVL